MAQDKKEFTLEDILEEQRRQREDQDFPAMQEPEPLAAAPQEEPAEEPVPPAAKRRPPQDPVPDDTADLNAYATGNFQVPQEEYEQESLAPAELPEEKPKKKKKKKGGLFGRKKKVPDFDEDEDMYYGIQLKPIDEYRKGFDPATGEFSLGADSFKDLFDDSKKAIDDEVEANFQKLQR